MKRHEALGAFGLVALAAAVISCGSNVPSMHNRLAGHRFTILEYVDKETCNDKPSFVDNTSYVGDTVAFGVDGVGEGGDFKGEIAQPGTPSGSHSFTWHVVEQDDGHGGKSSSIVMKGTPWNCSNWKIESFRPPPTGGPEELEITCETPEINHCKHRIHIKLKAL